MQQLGMLVTTATLAAMAIAPAMATAMATELAHANGQAIAHSPKGVLMLLVFMRIGDFREELLWIRLLLAVAPGLHEVMDQRENSILCTTKRTVQRDSWPLRLPNAFKCQVRLAASRTCVMKEPHA